MVPLKSTKVPDKRNGEFLNLYFDSLPLQRGRRKTNRRERFCGTIGEKQNCAYTTEMKVGPDCKYHKERPLPDCWFISEYFFNDLRVLLALVILHSLEVMGKLI